MNRLSAHQKRWARFIRKVRALSKHQSIEGARDAAEERLLSIINQAPLILFAIDHNGMFLLSEGSGLNVFGEKPGEVVGKSIYDVCRNVPRTFPYIGRALKGEDVTFPLEVKGMFFECRYTPIRDEWGAVIGVIGMTFDITERVKAEKSLQTAKVYSVEMDRKKAEDALQRELDFRDMVMENSLQVIFALDLEGRFTLVSRGAYITGYTSEEIVGRPLSLIFQPKELAIIDEIFSKVICEKVSVYRQESQVITKDGGTKTIRFNLSPFISDGQVIGAVGTAEDISEHKKAEEALRKADMLSVVGQLAAGVAHEIRNPLTSLKGFIQLIQKQSREYPQYFQIMLTELERIEFIVNEFLVLSKPQVVKFQNKDIRSLLDNVVVLLDSQAILNQAQIYMEYESNFPFIQCEENQLKQVFINLLKNAIEAMPGGGIIHIGVSRVDETQIRVRVTDQGAGIPKEMIHKLGEPFFSTKENGTGLGLMVSYKIVENHQGRMEINSDPGHGTQVDVYLPIDQAYQL